MLNPEEKADVVLSFKIELNRLMTVIEHQYHRKGTPDHFKFIARIQKDWKGCLKEASTNVLPIPPKDHFAHTEGPIAGSLSSIRE